MYQFLSVFDENFFDAVEQGELVGCLCSTTVTTIHYLCAKTLGATRAKKKIEKLLTLFEVAPVNRPVLAAALATDFAEFEDAVAYEAARHVAADAIVTRKRKDFSGAKIPVYSPAELAGILSLRDNQG